MKPLTEEWIDKAEGANANREDAFQAVEIASRIRSLLRTILNID